LSTFQTLSKEIKDIVAEEKSCIKQMNSVKEQLEKVLSKKTKLRRQKEEELMLKIFMEDGSQDFMMDQKLKKLNKYN
jgi:glutamate racemase